MRDRQIDMETDRERALIFFFNYVICDHGSFTWGKVNEQLKRVILSHEFSEFR